MLVLWQYFGQKAVFRYVQSPILLKGEMTAKKTTEKNKQVNWLLGAWECTVTVPSLTVVFFKSQVWERRKKTKKSDCQKIAKTFRFLNHNPNFK